ncbi:hypothetical protein DFH08DRAFT_879509, partial [Mycena albidolilacea]
MALTSLSIEFACTPGRDLQWINRLRGELYPDHIPAHITLLSDVCYESGLVEHIREIAEQYKPFDFELDRPAVRWKRGDQIVAIRLRDEENRFADIQMALGPWSWQPRLRPPHVTIFRGSGKNAQIKHRSRLVARCLNTYEQNQRGRQVRIGVEGLELVDYRGRHTRQGIEFEREILHAFPFGHP